MAFYGSCGKTRAGAGVWLYNSKTNQAEVHSYKLNFLCTNNITEYEALLLGLKFLKKVSDNFQGDFEIIIKQIKHKYSAKHPILREYQNAVIDFLKTFEEYDLVVIPRLQNSLEIGLDFPDNSCKLPNPNKQYTAEVKHHPAVPDNLRYWQVFGSDK